jgi:hypothetical protein
LSGWLVVKVMFLLRAKVVHSSRKLTRKNDFYRFYFFFTNKNYFVYLQFIRDDITYIMHSTEDKRS